MQQDIYFYNKKDFSYWKLLEENTDVILEELLGVIQGENSSDILSNDWQAAHPHYVEGQFEVSWKTFTFLFFGIKRLDSIKKCPITYALIQQIPELITAQFSLLLPKTQINPHKGYSPAILRNHLPVIVPEGDCGLKVGNQTHRWKKGELVVFDDSFEHEAWNHSDKTRVVLMFDVAKPNCGYDAKEICRYKIHTMDDPFLLSTAGREVWKKWHEQGFFDELLN